MKLDEAIAEAFGREIGAAPGRPPSADEIERACAAAARAAGYGPATGSRVGDSGSRAPASDEGAAYGDTEAHGAARRRRLASELAPIFALAAALACAMVARPESVAALRPLASEFSASLPADAGDRFPDFVIRAGQSYRSSKR